jgi:asparagine synthase (glutamine-hydrolysing)
MQVLVLNPSPRKNHAGLTKSGISIFVNGFLDPEGSDRLLPPASGAEWILEEYLKSGESFLEKLDGSFFLAVHDTSKKRSWIASDPTNQCGCYYTLSTGQTLHAASRPSLLRGVVRPEVAREELVEFLLFRGLNGNRTLFRNILRLESGHALSWGRDRKPTYSCYSPNHFYTVDRGWTESQYQEEFEQLISRSIRKLIEDTEKVGVLLSGGIDSSLLTALITECRGAPPNTYTLNYPGHQSLDHQGALEISEKYRTQHHSIDVDSAKFYALIRKSTLLYEEPLRDFSFCVEHLLFEAACSDGTELLMVGDYGDALFGPESFYSLSLLLWREDHPFTAALLRAAHRLAPGLLARFQRFRDIAEAGRKQVEDFIRESEWMHEWRFAERLTGSLPVTIERIEEVLADPRHRDFYEKLSEAEFIYGDNAYVRGKEKVVSRYNVRVAFPFLDRDLRCFGMSLEQSLKFIGRRRPLKFLPKMCLQKRIGEGFINRKKVGFDTLPLRSWLFSPEHLKDCSEYLERVRDKNSACKSHFNAEEVDRIVAAFSASRVQANPADLYTLITFEEWHRNFITATPEGG